MPASGRAVGREMNLPAKKHFMQSSVTAGVPHPPPPLLRGAFLGLVMRFQLQGFDRQRQWRRWCTVGGQIRRRRRHPGASGPCAPERCSHSWLVHVSTAGTKLKQHVHMGCRFTAPHDAATGHRTRRCRHRRRCRLPSLPWADLRTPWHQPAARRLPQQRRKSTKASNRNVQAIALLPSTAGGGERSARQREAIGRGGCRSWPC